MSQLSKLREDHAKLAKICTRLSEIVAQPNAPDQVELRRVDIAPLAVEHRVILNMQRQHTAEHDNPLGADIEAGEPLALERHRALGDARGCHVSAGDGVQPGPRDLVHAGFAHRRKTLAGSLALAPGAAPGVRDHARTVLERMGHPADARAERLAAADWPRLAAELAAR